MKGALLISTFTVSKSAQRKIEGEVYMVGGSPAHSIALNKVADEYRTKHHVPCQAGP